MMMMPLEPSLESVVRPIFDICSVQPQKPLGEYIEVCEKVQAELCDMEQNDKVRQVLAVVDGITASLREATGEFLPSTFRSAVSLITSLTQVRLAVSCLSPLSNLT